MAEKDKKTTEKSNPTYVVADQIIGDLARVHMRIPKF